jgi:rhodanese-related sulfurtransferase
VLEQVTPEEARRRLAAPHPPLLLDVRTDEEYLAHHAAEARLIPLHELVARLRELDPARPTLVVCEHGMRSLMAARFLVERAGFTRVANVLGGMSVWPTD